MTEILQEDKPDYKCADFVGMLPGLTITEDLWGGTLDIRAKKNTYLPTMPLEESDEYDNRLKSSVFFNEFQRTVESGVGMVFKTDPTPIEKGKIHNLFKEIFEDIDLQGSDLAHFLREAFTNAWRDGHSFILVDGPASSLNEDGTPVLLSEVLDKRPWWSNIKASQVPNWVTSQVDGKEVLEQITICYQESEKKGKYGEQSVDKFLTLTIGGFEVKKKQVVDSKEEFVLEREGSTGLDFIPIAPIYARKVKNMVSRPPLLELANLNILHYQKTSDFDNWCHICCVPILARRLDMRGDEEKSGAIPIGPTIMVNVFGQYGDLKYVEVSGAGLNVVKDRIKELEKQMTRLGVEMMSPTVAVEQTATEVIAKSGESQSQVAIAAKNLESAFKQAIYFTSKMFDKTKNIKLKDQDLVALQLNIDYNRLTFSVNQMLFFQGMVDKGLMSVHTFLSWLPKVTDMPKDFDATAEIEKIKSEADLRAFMAELVSKDKKDPNDPEDKGNSEDNSGDKKTKKK